MDMAGADFRRLNKTLARSFSAVKRDMNEIRDENKNQAKRIKVLVKENDGLKKLLDDVRKSVILSEQYDFIERRIDELEEEMFNLEDKKIDKKKFESSVAGIKHQFRTRENLGSKLNELKDVRAEIEHLKLAYNNLSDYVSGLKKANRSFITKIAFNKELKKLKEIASNLLDLKNSLAVIELRFDDMENTMTEVVKDKELMKVKNKINLRLRELEKQTSQIKKRKSNNIKNKSFLGDIKNFFLDFFEESKKKPKTKS